MEIFDLVASGSWLILGLGICLLSSGVKLVFRLIPVVIGFILCLLTLEYVGAIDISTLIPAELLQQINIWN